jgi:hypothetical protein
MMGEVSIHEYNEVTGALTKSVDVGATQTKLAWSSMQQELALVDLLEVLYDVLCTIWRVVIDYHYFHIYLTT